MERIGIRHILSQSILTMKPFYIHVLFQYGQCYSGEVFIYIYINKVKFYKWRSNEKWTYFRTGIRNSCAKKYLYWTQYTRHVGWMPSRKGFVSHPVCGSYSLQLSQVLQYSGKTYEWILLQIIHKQIKTDQSLSQSTSCEGTIYVENPKIILLTTSLHCQLSIRLLIDMQLTSTDFSTNVSITEFMTLGRRSFRDFTLCKMLCLTKSSTSVEHDLRSPITCPR